MGSNSERKSGRNAHVRNTRSLIMLTLLDLHAKFGKHRLDLLGSLLGEFDAVDNNHRSRGMRPLWWGSEPGYERDEDSGLSRASGCRDSNTGDT